MAKIKPLTLNDCPDTYLLGYNNTTGVFTCQQVDYHTIPEQWDPTLWFWALGVSLGCFIAIYGSYHSRPKCRWCNARHPRRHPLMTTEEYLRLFCGGWKAHLKQIMEESKMKKLLVVFAVSWGVTSTTYQPVPCVQKEGDNVICAKAVEQRKEHIFKQKDAAEAFKASMEEMGLRGVTIEERKK